MRTRDIIAGTDGTGSSRAAVDWAAREAQRRQLPLRIVHVFDWEHGVARYDLASEYIAIGSNLAEGVTANAVAQARQVAPEIEIEGEVLIGNAAARLLAEADGAELIVLGCRGRGGFRSLLLGSVSQRVATHSSCPVVVIRGRGTLATGPVAVGVDDATNADHVLETAFEAAAGRGCTLAVIRAYLPVIPLWLADVRAADVDTPEQDAAEHARLEEQLAPWRDKYPDVPIEIELTHGSAAAALVGVSARAQLVIVGSRGHGVVAGALLGSAGVQLLHHADCPVYIDRPRPGQAA